MWHHCGDISTEYTKFWVNLRFRGTDMATAHGNPQSSNYRLFKTDFVFENLFRLSPVYRANLSRFK